MAPSTTSRQNGNKTASVSTNLLAGGGAGMMEALICHPLDTVKVRMQLATKQNGSRVPSRGIVGTTLNIVRSESPAALYKGLGAVTTGIIPKMAIRFTSFEAYKKMLADPQTGVASSQAIFAAGLAAGVTEAVAVVNPMEVVKIRLQAQHGLVADTMAAPQYRSATHALYTIVEVEGLRALYRGVSLTALRQGTNQAVNFTAYNKFKSLLQKWQPQYENSALPSVQTTAIGLVSGAMGPLCNAPIDTIKTRLQKMPVQPGLSALGRITTIAADMFRQDGFHAFYKGITPRIMRVAPGQAITFTVYEFLKGRIEGAKIPRLKLGSEKLAI